MAIVEGFLDLDEELVGSSEDDADEWDSRAVMRVLTTQIGFVMRTVAEPAIAPARMDSTVVNFEEAREDFIAARSKKARVHSYPGDIRTNSCRLGRM